MKRLLLLGLTIPAFLFGQKNEIIALQRDVAQLQEHMTQAAENAGREIRCDSEHAAAGD